MRSIRKRAISPVVSTVLLVALVIIIALIIFFWFRSLVEEEGTKFGKNIKLVCDDVRFEASYNSNSGVLYISNTGNVPIFDMKLKTLHEREHETKELRSISLTWADGLNQGEVFSEDLSFEIGSPEKIILIPVLIGTSDEGEKSYACEENQGFEMVL